MLFKTTPKIEYDGKDIIDITKRVNIIQSVLNNKDLTYKYVLNQGDLPETVAYQVYNDEKLHWLILLTNGVYDPFYQWYMEDAEVLEYSKLIYGNPGFQDVRYWIKDDIKYQSDPGNGVAITNHEFETLENEEKREIKLIYPEYVPQIVKQFNYLIKL